MSDFPLISHTHGDAIVAWRHGEPIRAARFIADVRTVAAALPPGPHLLNACSDRYAFAVTLAAAMLEQRITLLPSTYTAEAVQKLTEFAPAAFCVADSDNDGIPLPTIRYPLDTSGAADAADAADGSEQSDAPDLADTSSGLRSSLPAAQALADESNVRESTPFEVPRIDAARVVAYVFTSGSTGVPVPHPKTWGRLVHCVHVAMGALGLSIARPCTLIGTVPPQHMFGFESTVLLALIGGQAFDASRPFYPADVTAAIEAAPRPRALISTPVHLRSLLLSLDGQDARLPELDLILSATAPLSQELAAQAEQAFHTSLMEIYGSTETGQIATRRTTQGDTWQLMPGIHLEWREGQAWASHGHIETPTALGDLLEPRGTLDAQGRATEFALTGRTADLVNIAGKRTSIGYLNHQITAIEGVLDAGFFMPDDERPGVVTRLAAFAVAPGMTASTLLARLRERIEAAFLPRPLVLVETLPRNETGKLVRGTLKALYDEHVASRRQSTNTLSIAADHPAYAGHFPGRPVLPGVVLLDEALSAISASTGLPLSASELSSAKFLSPVMPGEPLTLEQRTLPSGSIEFEIRAAERLVARGTVTP
jgi:acyl-coenzyme A synthetase/AMP-(fatty) acid ligase